MSAVRYRRSFLVVDPDDGHLYPIDVSDAYDYGFWDTVGPTVHPMPWWLWSGADAGTEEF